MKQSLIKEEKGDIKEIFRRIKKRDFSGNIGLAIKNSLYQFSTSIVAKIGSLIFTIILARLLMPELFGLYSLALSTILIFGAFSELGVNSTLVRYVSKFLGKNNNKKAKEYVIYLGKLKIVLIFISAFLLLITSRFISEVYYQKPLFLALVAGVFYILFINLMSLFSSILQASNYFRGVFYQEIIFQIARVILVPLAVIYTLKISLSNEIILFYVIIGLSVSYLFSSLYLSIIIKKKSLFLKADNSGLSLKNRKEVNHFLIPISIIVLSGVFFGNIDKIMLGRFVGAEFIGYYTAAFGLIGALVSLAGFGGIVLLPIFSRMKRKSLERAVKRSLKIVFLLCLILFGLTVLVSGFAVRIIYGQEYLLSTNVLRLLSALLLIIPITGIYIAYFMSKNNPKIIAKLLITSTIINITLNYFLITSLLKFGDFYAVIGACVATLISQGIYLAGLFYYSKKGDIGD